jgi:hypothetical protein
VIADQHDGDLGTGTHGRISKWRKRRNKTEKDEEETVNVNDERKTAKKMAAKLSYRGGNTSCFSSSAILETRSRRASHRRAEM